MKSYIAKAVVLYVIGVVLLLITFVQAQYQGFKFVVLDVDQGSGTYIYSEQGYEIVIDGGRHAKFIRSLNRERVWYDRYIDMVVLSHPDSDHMGGFPELIKEYDVGAFVHNGETSDSALYQELVRVLESKQVLKHVTKAGEMLYQDKNTRVLVLHPGALFESERNDNSVVVRVEHLGYSFLATGDISKKVERELMHKYKNFIDVDVLLAAHHGSRTSSDEDFVIATSPQYVVISAGKNNRYGHPHQNVLETYKKVNVPVLGTDEQGSITFIVQDGLNVRTAK